MNRIGDAGFLLGLFLLVWTLGQAGVWTFEVARIEQVRQAYGARQLTCYRSREGTCSEPLELLSALYNGEMRPVRKPDEGTDIGRMLPYRRASFGLDAMELRGSAGSDFAAAA